MLRSLYSGVAGLKTHQTKMDVIGNNIANANTTAFKASRVTFKDIYYQTVTGATGANATKGGTNPQQIGYGSAVASIDILNTRGGWQSTDRTLDLYIEGDGYFIVQDRLGNTSYTRNGNFNFDGSGGLVDANGNYVAGWVPSYSANTPVAPIIIPNIADYTNVTISKDGIITGIYAGDDYTHAPNTYEAMGNITSAITSTTHSNFSFNNGVIYGVNNTTGATEALYNNIKINDDGSITADNAITGASQELIGEVTGFTTNPEDYSGWAITTDGTLAGLYRAHYTGKVEDFGNINGPTLSVAGYTNVTFANGTITGVDGGGNTITLYTNVTINATGTFTGTNALTGTANETIPFLDINQFVNNTANYSDFKLAADGSLSATYIADQYPEHIVGETEVLGQIALANFANPDGLSQEGSVYFKETRNSGEPIISYPGANSTGSIISGGLEMSNVDLAKEFTDMITTQRGFQASSRIITTSDQLLEELVNLKR